MADNARVQLLVYYFKFRPRYQTGFPVDSSIADSIDGVVRRDRPSPAWPRRDADPSHRDLLSRERSVDLLNRVSSIDHDGLSGYVAGGI